MIKNTKVILKTKDWVIVCYDVGYFSIGLNVGLIGSKQHLDVDNQIGIVEVGNNNIC